MTGGELGVRAAGRVSQPLPHAQPGKSDPQEPPACLWLSPLHKPHAGEEGRAVSDEASGEGQPGGVLIYSLLSQWLETFVPGGAHVFTCVMLQLPQAGGAEVDSCSQACSRTCLGKRTLRGVSRLARWAGGLHRVGTGFGRRGGQD